MKIQLDKALIDSLEANEFDFRYGKIGDEQITLVNPRGFPKWTEQIMIFRSSVWNSEGELISASFKKFFNLTEAPHLVPDPTEKDILNAEILEKLDGSTLIVSKYRGHEIIRTRGTLDATVLDNGHEIHILKEKYPKAFDNALLNTERVTFIYEWLSDENKIILPYPDCPDIRLVAIIQHSDYSLYSQDELDTIAKEIGVKRPKRLDVKSLDLLLDHVKGLKDEEGFCIYYNNGQDIKKVKSPWYLALHRFKSNCSIEYILDFYIENGEPDYETFVNKIVAIYDHECLSMALPFASKVVEAGKLVESILRGMNIFVEKIKGLPTRKEQAQQIMSSYGAGGRSGFVFQLLDGKTLDKDARKKLYYQALKK